MALLSAGLQEPVFAMGGFFSVTFYRPIDFSDWIVLKTDELGERQSALLRTINANPNLTIRLIAENIQSSVRSVERDVAVLKSLGILERLGSDKEGQYKIHLIR